MRTCLSVRGLSLIPLCIALVAASACNSSPTEPGAVSDSGIVTRSQSFETAATSTEGVKRVDADGPDSDELAGDEIDAAPLTANTATATASRTVEVSGVTKDKNGKRIAGVAVKIAGKRLDTTDSRGRFSINVRTGRTVTIKFSKTGYNDASETESVTRAIRNMNVRLTPLPAADLSSLTLSESSVTVGTMVNATVTLTKVAPSAGAIVSLSSSSSSADVPASVKVPSGKKSAQFKVKAESAGSATITARYGKTNDKATLTITRKEIIEPVVARFTWSPKPCPVVNNPTGGVLVKCDFDARDSTAPEDSTYRWTLPDGSTQTTSLLSDPPMRCGLPNATNAFPLEVRLTVIAPDGRSDSVAHDVDFKKNGLC